MATSSLSSPGIGSGLDVNAIVGQLMSLERRPQQALATKAASYQAKLSAFGTLTNYLGTLQDSAKAWKGTLKTSATSSDNTVFTATSTTGAELGVYDIEVKHLAAANKVRSAGYAISDVISGGTLNLSLGTLDDHGETEANRTGNWTYNSTSTTAITFGGGSILNLRDAINAQAGSMVTAQVVTGVDGMHLSITPKNKGLDNTLNISGTGNPGTLTDLAAFNYDITDLSQNTNMTEISIPWSTEATIDGLTVRSNTNTITNAIRGVSINVLKQSEVGTPTSLSVGIDKQSVIDQVNGFINAYNGVKLGVKTQTTYNASTNTAAPLSGDSSARGITNSLYTAFTSVPASLGSATYKRFFEIGLKVRNDGNLELDLSKLQTALDTDPTAVVKMLNAYGTQFNQAITGMTDSRKGTLTARTQGLNASIRDFNTRSEALDLRMSTIEANYRKQFNALDSTVASLQSTQSALQQQLSSLSRYA